MTLTYTLENLPPRIPASKVCELAGYGRSTLRARIIEGKMPRPVDRGKEALFPTKEVLERLGLFGQESAENPFEQALNELEKT